MLLKCLMPSQYPCDASLYIAECLKVIDITTAKSMNLKPGQKICKHCYKQFREGEKAESDDELYQPPYKPSDLNATAAELGCSPLKTMKLGYRDKASYAKKKVSQIKGAAKSKVSRILRISTDDLISSDEAESVMCEDFNILMKQLKEKCTMSTKQEQISILTLAPSSWTIDKTAAQFNVSRHLVKRARDLKKSTGILSKPMPKKGKQLTDAIKLRVAEFYDSDEYSRVCPGKKDYVSIKVDDVRVQVQKRLLLVNLKELYIAFTTNTGLRIGFSKFCELRPKSCVTVSASGMHSVCVCEIHQNAKLFLAAVPGKLNYKDVMSKMVCSVDNRNCMLHECDSCPGKDAVTKYLTEQFHKEDMDDDDFVQYKQWLHTDRTTLVSLQLPVTEFIQTICESLDCLRQHQYIAKAQAAHLRTTKENLALDSVVILMDFAENYSFVVQDAVQGHHWNNSQATLHPFTVYYKEGTELKCLSLCVVSDYLQHNTNVVHAFMHKALCHLKTAIQNVTRVIYFTDGAASQYKNYKNLTNLCHHKNDFGIDAEWHFFATSHGKSSCDGIGGTVKRLAARASLQAATCDQILDPQQLFEWASANIHGIHFFFLSTEDIQSHESSFALENRYSTVKTIVGTRSHHSFVPLSRETMQMKRISSDSICSIIHLNFPVLERHSSQIIVKNDDLYQPGRYVACTYDNEWLIGNIVERSDLNKDLLIDFMQRKEATRLLWPLKTDRCWVPFQHILCTIDVPLVEGSSARQYKLAQQDHDRIITLYNHSQ